MADAPRLIRPNLREMEWLGVNRCRAVFETEAGERIETEFVLQRGPVGSGASKTADARARPIGRHCETLGQPRVLRQFPCRRMTTSYS